jgi:hypothetical protein
MEEDRPLPISSEFPSENVPDDHTPGNAGMQPVAEELVDDPEMTGRDQTYYFADVVFLVSSFVIVTRRP